MRTIAGPTTWAEKRAVAWSWTRFLFLMFSVGAMPFTVEAPFPLLFPVACVILTVTLITAAVFVLRRSTRSPIFVASSTPPRHQQIAVAGRSVVSLPTDPGVPGGAQSRAPSRAHSRISSCLPSLSALTRSC